MNTAIELGELNFTQNGDEWIITQRRVAHLLPRAEEDSAALLVEKAVQYARDRQKLHCSVPLL